MPIGITNLHKLFASEPTCQETTGMIGNDYLRCGAPAELVVLSERGKQLYFMCLICGTHNVQNRGVDLILQKLEE